MPFGINCIHFVQEFYINKYGTVCIIMGTGVLSLDISFTWIDKYIFRWHGPLTDVLDYEFDLLNLRHFEN